jgi:hypothetical protein
MDIPQPEEKKLTKKQEELYFHVAEMAMRRVPDQNIAEIMRVSLNRIRRIRRDPIYHRLYEELQVEWNKAAQAKVADYVLEAVQTMRELMLHSPRDHVRYEAAKAIGDWAGLGREKIDAVKDDREGLEKLYELMKARQQQAALPAPSVQPSVIDKIPESVPGEYQVLESIGQDSPISS